MASFNTHLSVATVAVGVITVPLLSWGMINIYEAILLLFFGVIGGMLPDIDSDNSIPVKITMKIFSLIIPLLVIFNFTSQLELLKIFALWILFSIVLYMIFTYGFLKLTVHRGIFHTIGMGVVCGELVALFLINSLGLEENLAMLAGLYVLFGYLTHLLLDEVYSVDLYNSKLKRSFGSAFKIYDKKNIVGSIFVNALAIALFYMLPNLLKLLNEIENIVQNVKLY